MSRLKVCLTHDIDRTRKTYQYLTRDIKSGKLSNLSTLVNGSQPYWQFEKMVELEEKYGAISTVFFLHETAPLEIFKPKRWQISLGRYSINDPVIKGIIRWLDEKGWEVGVHGSYYSYKNLELLQSEKHVLEDVLGHEVKGIRQHYMNLEEPLTWNLQKRAGFEYDSSLGRTDRSGYSDHRIRPFTDFCSGMLVLPLTLMECYLFKEAGHDPRKALFIALSWMDHAQENGVPFTILWHQRMFNEEEFPGYRWVYEELIKEACQREARFVTCRQLVDELQENVAVND